MQQGRARTRRSHDENRLTNCCLVEGRKQLFVQRTTRSVHQPYARVRYSTQRVKSDTARMKIIFAKRELEQLLGRCRIYKHAYLVSSVHAPICRTFALVQRKRADFRG